MIIRRLVLAALALFVVAGVAGAQSVQKPLEKRRIVVFDKTAPRELRVQTMQRLGARIVRELGLIDALVVAVPATALEMDARLRQAPLVVRVDEDIYRKWLFDDSKFEASIQDAFKKVRTHRQEMDMPTPMPGVGSPADPTGNEAPWGILRVSAPQAWGNTQGQGVKVAVIDTGIDFQHPDLAANTAGGFNAINSSATAQDDHGHGTHVAGTVGAIMNGTGVVGVAPRVSLYGVKVLDANGSGWISDIIAGIDWAVKEKVAVINMSLGGPRGNDAFHEAVKKAVEGGVAVICAAGNSGAPRNGQTTSVGFPAAYPEAVAISALQQGNATVPETIAGFSSRGPEVDFIAPGAKVLSTIPGGGYREYSGTSMASPHAAGLAALAVSRGAASPNAIREALKAASKPVKGLTANDQGAGMPDAAKIAGATDSLSSSR